MENSKFVKAILQKTDKMDQKGKLIRVDAGGIIEVLEPVFQKVNGFIFEKGDGNHSVKIEGKKEDFIYWAWDIEHAKKILDEKILQHERD